MRTVIFLIALFLLPGIIWGQPLNAPLRFTNYTVADGLPTNTVNDIIQDSRGFVWMGTAQGLVRFDGNKFTVYNHSRADSNSMPFDDIKDCIELNNHELVFGSNGKIWMLNPMNGKQHPPPFFWKSKTEVWPKKLSGSLIAVKSLDKFYFTDYNLQVIDSVYLPVINDFFEPFYLGENEVLISDKHRLFSYSINSKKMVEWKLDKASFYPLVNIYVKDADTINKKFISVGMAPVSSL